MLHDLLHWVGVHLYLVGLLTFLVALTAPAWVACREARFDPATEAPETLRRPVHDCTHDDAYLRYDPWTPRTYTVESLGRICVIAVDHTSPEHGYAVRCHALESEEQPSEEQP